MNFKKIIVGTLACAAFFSNAENVFNITNYPNVFSIHESFNQFKQENPAFGGYSLQENFWKAISSSAKTNYLEEIIRISQDGFVKDASKLISGFPEIYHNVGFESDYLHNVDERLANLGVVNNIYLSLWDFSVVPYFDFPMTIENKFSTLYDEFKANHNVRITLFRRYLPQMDLPVPAKIEILMEELAIGDTTDWSEENLRSQILIAATKDIRHELRKNGKTFFVDKKTGKNPIDDAIDGLIKGLNAPKFNGVKEWVLSRYPDYEWVDITCWRTDEQIDKMKEDIYYGDIEFSLSAKKILRSHLGVEGFNDFVRYYNGESQTK